jgi:hypothetical protein
MGSSVVRDLVRSPSSHNRRPAAPSRWATRGCCPAPRRIKVSPDMSRSPIGGTTCLRDRAARSRRQRLPRNQRPGCWPPTAALGRAGSVGRCWCRPRVAGAADALPVVAAVDDCGRTGSGTGRAPGWSTTQGRRHLVERVIQKAVPAKDHTAALVSVWRDLEGRARERPPAGLKVRHRLPCHRRLSSDRRRSSHLRTCQR